MKQNTGLIPFDYEGHEIRVVQIDGQPWFVLADLARVLGYRDASNAARALRERQKGTHVVSTPGGDQRVRVASWGGLFRLVLRSNNPNADLFQDWVTDEMLPALSRGELVPRHQQFEVPQTFAEALELAARKVRELDAATTQLAVQAPKVEAFEALMNADGTYSMGTVANILGFGRNTLFRRMREDGILQRDNRPYQRYAHHFKVTAGSHDRNGRDESHFTTFVRPSGLEFLRRRYQDGGGQLMLVAT